MSRRIARELVLQSLFQIDFTECEPQSALEAALAEREEDVASEAVGYAAAVLQGVAAHRGEIDERISRYAIDWTLERMPAMDRNILRLAVYELFFADEKLAPGVAINEAVEIAKRYGTDESPKFINGVLGQMVR